jgi:hypothetical protein
LIIILRSTGQVGRRRGDLPGAAPHAGGLRQEVRHAALVEQLHLALLPALEELLAAAVEGAVELLDQRQRLGGEDLLAARNRAALYPNSSHVGPP